MIGSASTFRRRLLKWFAEHRRELPWRTARDAPPGARPDPYAVLVSEAMLQQTQVATVLKFYKHFMDRFPTVRALAGASEQSVLRAWQGLGYYSRARNLRAAAAMIVRDFAGKVPSSVEQLLTLPGVGRYTAGAIASLAFDQRAPILDGNVARVLCRLEAIQTDPRNRLTQQQLWQLAEDLVPARAAGDFNSAMMELGATICVPRNPRCTNCPVHRHCRAQAEGLVDQIPKPRQARSTPVHHRVTLCVLTAGAPKRRPRVLIEQRPKRGRWASMWQFPTRPAEAHEPDWSRWRRMAGDFATPRPLMTLRHQLTHRRYEFAVFVTRAKPPAGAARHPMRWVGLDELDQFPLPRPHEIVSGELSAMAGSFSPRRNLVPRCGES